MQKTMLIKILETLHVKCRQPTINEIGFNVDAKAGK